MPRIKSILPLSLATLLSVLLLAACGQSELGEVKLDFAAFDQTRPAALKNVAGLSDQEPFGIWSKDKMVTFEFDRALPKKFTLSLKGYAFGPNVGQEFRAMVGSKAQTFTLPANNPATITIALENSDKAKILSIEVPSPTRPRDLNLNQDGRQLGLAFYELSITPL